jgi:hypothetical protein
LLLLRGHFVTAIDISGDSDNAVGMYKLLIATDWTFGFDANVDMDAVGIRFGCDLYGDAAFAAPCGNAVSHAVPRTNSSK